MTRSTPRHPVGLLTRFRRVLQPALGLGALMALSACAGHNNLSASQEASDYEHGARRSYNAPGSASDPWGPYIHEASAKYDVPERWVREVMRVETGGRTERNGRPITSAAGAMGLMQVMPSTYDELKARYNLGEDPYDPHNSIMAGTAYIRELYDLYGSPGFLAAYNGGPGRLDDYLTRNRALPDETRRYVAKIGPYITDSFPNKRSTAEMYAMNTMPSSIPAGPRYAAPQPHSTMTAAYVPPPEPYVPPATPVRSAPPPAPVQSAPVEVAYAPPSDTDETSAGWSPAPMPRGADRAYVPPAEPVQVPVRRAPMQVAEVPPPPPPPMPRQAYAAAALPEPPRYAAPTVQTASAYAPMAARGGNNFHLVTPAVAAPAPVYKGATGQWAIQVGAFGNEGLAQIAVGSAREQAGATVAGARPSVATVREPHGTLYRARLTGLSRDAAAQACERIRTGRSNCIVLSPDAQS